jgi:hypothetical protein
MVVWKPIEDFPGYEVSSDGQVRHGAKIKKTEPDRKGYRRVKLWRDGKASNRFVAPLVARAFIGLCPPGQTVRHRDGVNTNNVATNLQYGTRSENELDKREHGTAPQGENHPAAKLTQLQVDAIRARYKPYSRVDGIAAIAREYSLWPNTVWKIVHWKRWK